MIIFPAIDLRAGKVVRLVEGDPDRQTTFGDDPVAAAARWISEGAQWLHVVNLDGAFDQSSANLAVLEAICRLGTPVQFGGGLRTGEAVAQAFEAGAARVVIGTVAIQNPPFVGHLIRTYGDNAVAAALDARDGKVTTRGWQVTSSITPVQAGTALKAHGLRYALYTDVGRDGGLQGADVLGTASLATETGLQVIASGGVSTVEDLQQLARCPGVCGAVIGMALYTGRLSLGQALQAANGA